MGSSASSCSAQSRLSRCDNKKRQCYMDTHNHRRVWAAGTAKESALSEKKRREGINDCHKRSKMFPYPLTFFSFFLSLTWTEPPRSLIAHRYLYTLKEGRKKKRERRTCYHRLSLSLIRYNQREGIYMYKYILFFFFSYKTKMFHSSPRLNKKEREERREEKHYTKLF